LLVSVYIGLVAPCGIITSISSFIYITKFLTITPHIHKVLQLESIYSFVLVIIHSVGYFNIVVSHNHSFTYCSMFIDALPGMFFSSGFFSCMISTIRYYMSNRTGNNRLVDHIKIESRSNMAFLLLFCITTFIIYLHVEFQVPISPVVLECSGLDSYFSYIGLFTGVSLLIMTSICLYYDILLIKFIRLQNRVQPVKMVAWVSNIVQSLISTKNDRLNKNVKICFRLLYHSSQPKTVWRMSYETLFQSLPVFSQCLAWFFPCLLLY
jgi:hypothetical protein